MTPTEDQIRTTAYSLWVRRGCRDGHDVADWLDAEQDTLLQLNYQVIMHVRLDEPEKQFTGSRTDRRCRYCECGSDTVTFNDESHALPVAFGNSSLIAYDECDQCNKYFSETHEDSFGKLFLPYRTALTISGRRRVPKHKDGRIRIEYDVVGNGFQVQETGTDKAIHDDPDKQQLSLSLTLQPYVPIRVLKCLAKMGLAIMPEPELQHFALTRRWLLERDDTKWLDKIGASGCYTYLSRVPYPHPWAALIRRRSDDTPLPYMMLLFGVSRLLLQAHVPLTPKDNICVGHTVIVPRVGSFVFPYPLENHWAHLPLASTDLVRGGGFELVLGYRDRQVLDKPS